MPQIKIKRGDFSNDSTTKLAQGEPAFDTSDRTLKIGNTDTSGGSSVGDSGIGVEFAQKIGSNSSHPPIGSSTIPVYVDSNGTVTASSSTVGADETPSSPTDATKGLKPVFMSNGQVMAASKTHGTDESPVYISSGKIIPGKKYAGGTKVTLNDVSKESSDISIYATTYPPEGIGTAAANGKIVMWRENPGQPMFSDDTDGSPTKPIWLGDGKTHECEEYAGGTNVTLNGSPKGAADASFYAPESAPTDRLSIPYIKLNGSWGWGYLSNIGCLGQGAEGSYISTYYFRPEDAGIYHFILSSSESSGSTFYCDTFVIPHFSSADNGHHFISVRGDIDGLVGQYTPQGGQYGWYMRMSFSKKLVYLYKTGVVSDWSS